MFALVWYFALILTAISNPPPKAISKPVWRPPYPLTTQDTDQWKTYEATAAKKSGMTFDEFQMFERALGFDPGHILLYDTKNNAAVWYKSNRDGSVHDILLTQHSGPTAIANVQYTLNDGSPRGKIIYSSDVGNLQKPRENRHAAIWTDLNADGIFDELVIPIPHNDLLNLDFGCYIVVNGKWIKSEPKKGATDHEFARVAGDKTYYFDSTSGTWGAKAATKPIVNSPSPSKVISQPAWRPPYPPTSQPAIPAPWAAQWADAAKRTGKTAEELWSQWLRESPMLLYDFNANLAVSYTANADGSAKEIDIAPLPGESQVQASIQYNLPQGKKPASITYSGPLPKNADDHRDAIWIDLNADGVFDCLLVPTHHNDLLNLDHGVYILLNGQWARTTIKKGQSASETLTAMVGDVTCHFDSASGSWIAQKK